MNKEIKQSRGCMTSADYASPSVCVISVKTSRSILSGSEGIYNTNPADMNNQDVF